MIAATRIVPPESLWGAWTLDPTVIVGVVVAGVVYGRGLRRSRRAFPARWIVGAFYGGLAALVLALVSPLAAVGETLFAAHMVQHLVLIVIAAPLLAVGARAQTAFRGLPARLRSLVAPAAGHPLSRRVRNVVLNPVVATGMHIAIVWSWHLPAPYRAALTTEPLHALEHVSLLASGFAFWFVALRSRAQHPARILVVFAVAVASGALGAILTFAGAPLYRIHSSGPTAWGTTALADQQLAGAIMWVPGGVVYLVAMAALFARWLARAGEHVERVDASKAGIP